MEKLDKSVIKITSLTEELDEKEYWLTKTPAERLIALELMREINYGKNATTLRLQRFFEITELQTS